MVALSSLWLPILLSGVVVFLVSFVMHMVLPWHHGDYQRLPNEDGVLAALRPFNIPPGDYMIPRPGSRQDMQSPEFKSKVQQGPRLIATVLPGGDFSMGRNLAGWFVYIVVVSVFGGYIASRAVPPGTEYLRVFRFVGTTAFAGYSLALWQMTIWYQRSVGTTLRSTIDGLIYACLTAGVFGWLWPR